MDRALLAVSRLWSLADRAAIEQWHHGPAIETIQVDWPVAGIAEHETGVYASNRRTVLLNVLHKLLAQIHYINAGFGLGSYYLAMPHRLRHDDLRAAILLHSEILPRQAL